MTCRLITLWILLLPGLLCADAPYDWRAPPPRAPKGEVFTPAERAAFFPSPRYTPDRTGLDAARLRPAPAAGTHPRVYVTPGDLPEIRARIKTSKAAGMAYEKLRAETATFFEEGERVEKEDVKVISQRPKMQLKAQENPADDLDIGLDEEDNTVFRKTTAAALADGSATVDLLNGGQKDHARIELTRMLALNALRALLDDDEKRGARVAAALATYGKLCLAQMAAGKPIGAYRPVHYLTLAYDYAAPFMSDAQRQPVRKAIATSLTQPFRFLDGAMYGVGHPRPSHNWMSLVSQYIMCLAMVIEGEDPGIPGIGPDYAAQAVKTIADSATRWVHYFYDRSGASFEGLGKCQLNAFHYVALARRGNPLLYHPHVRRHLDSWLPALLQPWGYQYTAHSGWGGSYNSLRTADLMPMKWLLPDDRKLDFVYRNAVQDDYSRIEPLDVIFATDCKGPKDWAAHAKWAGMPVGHVSRGRAMLNARSGWQQDAAWLQVVCDQQWTAHMQTEIGNFMFSSHGRAWAYFIHANDSVGASSYHSVLLIDGVQQKGLGRMLNAGAGDIAAFATVDWAPAYNGYVDKPTQKPSYNDYHPLAPIDAPYAASRTTEFSWRDPWEKKTVPADWKAETALPLKHAYRTVGMVRGPRPYVLVMDDVQPADGALHSFDWYMQLESDVVVVSITNKTIKGFEFKDILLASDHDAHMATKEGVAKSFGHRVVKKGKRALLVRLLRSNTAPGRHSPAPGVLETYNNVPSWPNTDLRPVGKRLKIQTWARNPEYLVMLYPHRIGDELPKTTWEGEDALQVSFKGQLDLFTFTKLPDGRPAFTLNQTAGVGSREKRFVLGHQVDELDDAMEEAGGGLLD
jgi:hypothetical protein